jgi:hypothetical protein
MTPALAVQWLAWTVRRPVDEMAEVVADVPSGTLVKIGRLLEASPVVNPRVRPAPSKKVHRAVCQCGCGQWFEREYRTNRPKYKNAAHAAHARYLRGKEKG